MPLAKTKSHRAGLIALVGRPNVGKSTLLNQLMRRKVSITSRRANTTRHRILAVVSEPQRQFVFVDTPGFNAQGKRLVDRAVHKTAVASMHGVDMVLFMVECRGWKPGDAQVWAQIQAADVPAIIVINKIDRLRDRDLLLPVMKDLHDRTSVTDIVPISARRDENIERLKDAVAERLPLSPPLFPEEFVVDKNENFQVSELVREQIFRRYGAELPYVSAVEIEKFEFGGETTELDALIWVESEGQKRIVLGRKGEKLRQVVASVQKEVESRYEKAADVRIWIKIRTKWTESERHVSFFGYSETE